MKNRFLIFLVALMFVCNIKVNAFPASTGIISQQGSTVTTKLDTLALKYYDNTAVFCTQFYKNTPAGKNLTCQAIDWENKNISVGVAYIIRQVGNVPITGNAPDNYYYGELSINEYLCNKGIDETNTCVRGGKGQAEETLNDVALNWYNTAMSLEYKAASITFSTNELVFTKEGDNYVSNTVTITNEVDDASGYATVTTNKGTVIQNGNSFKVSIPVSSIASGETITVNVSASVSKTNYLSKNYNCGSDYQTVTPNIVETETTTAKATATGTITAPVRGKLIINKVDKNGNPVIGATIFVTSRTDDNIKEKFVSDGTPKVFDNLELGKYSIDEEVVPAGYLKAEGQIVNLSESNPTATITLVDEYIKISILKIDENGKPLSGVKLKLLDKDSKSLDICKDSNGNKISCEWTTTKDSYDIYNLPAGTYYIKEVSVPKGYNINPNKIKVEVSVTGEVRVDGKKVDNALIKILNDLTRTEISKISAVNGKELPGATLQILDKDEKSISCIIINKDGKSETLKECKWVSGEESTIVLGLPAGTYFLEETIAPEGYELNKNRVEFKIKADGSTTKVEMKNDLMVKVPDTLSSRSALLIAISMFDIALGIGIITYVKKNKVQE